MFVHPHRHLQLLLQATSLKEGRPWHAADNRRPSTLTGEAAVGRAEHEGAGCQMHLLACACNGVDPIAASLALQVEPEERRRPQQLQLRPATLLPSQVIGRHAWLLSG